MHAKRLLRLIVSPGSLVYLALGFVGGLLWLNLTARTPALPDAPAAIRPSDAGRVSLQTAINSVRRFAGAPSLVLEGGLQQTGAGDRQVEVYYLESISPIRGEDFFKVDARTGEVIEATFRSRLAPAETSRDLSVGEAEVLASRFARAHFWGFQQLTLVDRTIRTGESGSIHTFRWSQVSSETGAELPVSVTVAVAGRSGEVFWYLSQRDPLQIDTRPAVDREQALQTARTWLLPRDDRWNLDRPSAVRLQVLYDDDDRQQLVWSVVFAAREDGPRTSIRLLVDAQSGQLIQSGS